MPKSQILVVDALNGQPVRLAPDSSLILSSAGAAWSGITVEHQRLPPTETGLMYMPQHMLSIQLKPPKALERKEKGRLQRTPIAHHDLIFLAAGSPGEYAWREATEVLNLALDPAFVARVAEDFSRTDLVSEYGVPDSRVLHIGLALKAELEQDCIGGRLYVESLATALAVYVLNRFSPAKPVVRDYSGGLPPYRLRRALEYIHAHLTKDIRLAEVAGAVGLSNYYFARQFKYSTGLTPQQYILGQRIELAKQLLSRSDLTVTQISYQVGFATPSHFTAHFHRLTGITPTEYRKAL